MSFLQSLRFTKSSKVGVASGNQRLILDIIRRKIIEREADGVVMTDQQVKYQGSTYRWGWGRPIFNDVERGEFNLAQKDGKWVVIYKIYFEKSSLYVPLILSLTAGVIMQLGERKWWIGLLVFLWFYGLSFVITVMRHDFLGEDLIQEIDKLFADGQHANKNQDGEKLKSWF